MSVSANIWSLERAGLEVWEQVQTVSINIQSAATQGLSTYILNQGEKLKHRGVAIAYDCRHNSIIYALEAAWRLQQMVLRPILSGRIEVNT